MNMKAGRDRSASGKRVNAEKIKVCIRVRPLLAPYEDEEVWAVDLKENKINSLNSAVGTDPMTIMMNQI